MIPREHTLILLEDELPSAMAWGKRHSIAIEWLHELLELRVTLVQAETSIPFYLRGQFGDYREIPPAWTFTDATWTAAPVQSLFPKQQPPPTGGSSMFHTQPVICAPFNRLAYKAEHGGPHENWGSTANWLKAGSATDVKAHRVGDMLSAIELHFSVTRGRMA